MNNDFQKFSDDGKLAVMVETGFEAMSGIQEFIEPFERTGTIPVRELKAYIGRCFVKAVTGEHSFGRLVNEKTLDGLDDELNKKREERDPKKGDIIDG